MQDQVPLNPNLYSRKSSGGEIDGGRVNFRSFFIKKKRVAIENIKSRQSWYRSLYPEVKFQSAICSS